MSKMTNQISKRPTGASVMKHNFKFVHIIHLENWMQIKFTYKNLTQFNNMFISDLFKCMQLGAYVHVSHMIKHVRYNS